MTQLLFLICSLQWKEKFNIIYEMQLISERKRIISTNHARCYYHNRNYYRPILLLIT